MAMVADASVVVAWFVKGQATDDTDRLLDRATREAVHVPSLWQPEFVNALITLERRRRLPASEVDDALRAVADFDIVTEREIGSLPALAALARHYIVVNASEGWLIEENIRPAPRSSAPHRQRR